MPTVRKLIREIPGGDPSALNPTDSALLFAIYYAAITSMEETDVSLNFGTTRAKLNLKFRIGFEQAMAAADFLNNPTLTLVQALTIFLFLARLHDSPRFIWMMTGIAIRMAQAIGLQRDGCHFPNLSPYEIEMRRRVWWALCMIDSRASGDQGTDLTILQENFDTRMPLNINDSDINIDTKVMPEERKGITDMTITAVSCGLVEVERKMIARQKEGATSPETTSAIFEELFSRLDHTYLRYSNPNNDITYWVGVMIARLVAAKMTLVLYLPTIMSAPRDLSSNHQRDKLLVAAIEVAEYNHTLNSEDKCKHWRWVFQTYTHMYAIVYLLLSATQRPWSPLLERAWIALQSQWLIPSQYKTGKNTNLWVPIRKLTVKARRHRDAEFKRLRQDPTAANALELEDRQVVQPSSPGLFPGQEGAECMRARWRGILSMTLGSAGTNELPAAPANDNTAAQYAPSSAPSLHRHSSTHSYPNLTTPDQLYQPTSDQNPDTGINMAPDNSINPGFQPWLWTDNEPVSGVFTDMGINDVDLDMDMDADVDWSAWLATAELDQRGANA